MTSFAAFTDLFGNSLTSKDGPIETSAALTGKFVGIYFSAHWCPPCRRFTPELVKFYNDFKASGRKDFEIVFVSSDKSDSEFQGYYGEMPWLALPFSDRERKGKLSSKFKVQGIPTFVILDQEGNLITSKGREKVSSDPTASSFPWIPLSFEEELGTTFVSSAGTVTKESFAGKFIGLYFSAHWCPPCRQFTPKLITFYNRRKEKGINDFEVIFCSSDQAEPEFSEYFGSMPWLALPFQDPRVELLSSRFEIEGIPGLVIIDPSGRVVTKNARPGVESDPEGATFPFYPLPVEELSKTAESFGLDLNSRPALIVFAEAADDEEQEACKQALLPFGRSLAAEKASTPDGPEFLFFTAFGGGRIVDQIRKIAGLGSPGDTKLLLLDIPDNGGFYVSPATDITEEVVGKFIEDYKSGALALSRQQLGR